jgi:hypothetical protein
MRWVVDFVVRIRDVMGIFEEAPRETQILLDQQLCVASVPGSVDGQGLIGMIQPMCKAFP